MAFLPVQMHALNEDDPSVDSSVVIWHGMPIGRIMKSSGVPSHADQWWLGCSVCGKPSYGGDSGHGADLEDCKGQVKVAWARIRAALTDADIANARRSSHSIISSSTQCTVEAMVSTPRHDRIDQLDLHEKHARIMRWI